jgi:hypothetical protein
MTRVGTRDNGDSIPGCNPSCMVAALFSHVNVPIRLLEIKRNPRWVFINVQCKKFIFQCFPGG